MSGLVDVRGHGKRLPLQSVWLGCHLLSQVTHGRWSQPKLLNDINWLELRVAHLARRHFQTTLAGQHVLLLTEYYSQGSCEPTGQSLFQDFNVRADRIMSVGGKAPSLTASGAHLQCIQHSSGLAEQNTIKQSKRQLHPDIFLQITEWFRTPTVDFFATPFNTQLLRFWTPTAEDTNTLHNPWPQACCMPFIQLPSY